MGEALKHGLKISDNNVWFSAPCPVVFFASADKFQDEDRRAFTIKDFLLDEARVLEIGNVRTTAMGHVYCDIFAKGYIASQSSHSRGSTVDLTLLDMNTGKEVDMGGPFDLFSEVSHPDYTGITDQQYENRMLLQRAMVKNGFVPIDCEWWHFTLKDEPFPDVYFDFPVSAGYLKR